MKLRILILGRPASGKTTLAHEIAQKYNLQQKSMDDIYWLDDWVRPKHEDFLLKLDEFISNDEWILDGNYLNYLDERLDRATHVIYIDTCFFVVLKNYVKRSVRRYTGIEEMPENVKKRTVNFRLSFILKKILLFNILYKNKTIYKVRKKIDNDKVFIYNHYPNIDNLRIR